MTESPPNPPWYLIKITSNGPYHLHKPPGCKEKLTEEEMIGESVMVDITVDDWLCGEDCIIPLTMWCDECLGAASKFHAKKNYSGISAAS